MPSCRLLSFNIDGYSNRCQENRHWDQRAPVCMDIFQRHDPDLIGLQEVQIQNRSALDTHLSQYASEYGLKTCHQTDEEALYNPIYWKTNRFERLDAGAFYLSKTPDIWSKSWDAVHVRGLTWVHLRFLETDISFIYANVHLDHRGARARIESSKLIVRKLMQLRQSVNLAVFMSGDFNARPWSPPEENVYDYPSPILPPYLPVGGTVHAIYKEHGFRDTYLEAGHSNQLDMNTYHDYYGEAFPPVALRIDWILTFDEERQIRSHEYVLIRDASPPIYASDHYPIMGHLTWHGCQ